MKFLISTVVALLTCSASFAQLKKEDFALGDVTKSNFLLIADDCKDDKCPAVKKVEFEKMKPGDPNLYLRNGIWHYKSNDGTPDFVWNGTEWKKPTVIQMAPVPMNTNWLQNCPTCVRSK